MRPQGGRQSNQAGIETVVHHATKWASEKRQSNQAGIETCQRWKAVSDGGVRQSNQAGIETLGRIPRSYLEQLAPIEPSWD